MKTKSFFGIHNVLPPRSIPDSALVDAVDVDLNDSGNVLRRAGIGLKKTIPITSSYLTHDGVPYVVSDGTLYRVDDDLSFVHINTCNALEFADYSEILFTVDGLQVFKDKTISLDVPHADSPIVDVTGGSMPAGRYIITTTYINANGLMSGISEPVSVVLENQGGIHVTPIEEHGTHVIVWMTEAHGDKKSGGEVFYNFEDGSILPDIFLSTDGWPHGAEKIEYFDSRICLSMPFSNYTAIYFSERNHFHLFDYVKNVVIIPGHIREMKATAEALIVGTDTELYATDLVQLTTLARYGVPAGRSMALHPDNGQVYIHSNRGTCVALPFQNLTDKKQSITTGSQCSTQIVHQRGMQQFVALNNGYTEPYNHFY